MLFWCIVVVYRVQKYLPSQKGAKNTSCLPLPNGSCAQCYASGIAGIQRIFIGGEKRHLCLYISQSVDNDSKRKTNFVAVILFFTSFWGQIFFSTDPIGPPPVLNKFKNLWGFGQQFFFVIDPFFICYIYVLYVSKSVVPPLDGSIAYLQPLPGGQTTYQLFPLGFHQGFCGIWP